MTSMFSIKVKVDDAVIEKYVNDKLGEELSRKLSEYIGDRVNRISNDVVAKVAYPVVEQYINHSPELQTYITGMGEALAARVRIFKSNKDVLINMILDAIEVAADKYAEKLEAAYDDDGSEGEEHD